MAAEDVIVTRLKGYADLTALIGQRVYPVRAPQGAALPFVTYQRIGGSPVNGSTAESGTSNITIQVDCIAVSYKTVKQIADAVRGALSKWFSGATSPGLNLSLTAERDDYDKPVHADEVGVYRVMQDYSVWHD